jgi:cell wall-associated NlpC family hydrolase
MAALTGKQIVSEITKLGNSARGYSETLDGGTGPQYYDCSGLIQKALTALGVQGFPRDTQEQWNWLQSKGTAHAGPPGKNQLAIGDLVYATFAGDNMVPGHVGVYVGGGQMYSAEDPAAGIGLSSLASWESGGTVNGWATIPGSSVDPGTGSGTSGSSGGSWLGFLSDPISAATDMLKIVEFLINPLSWLRIIAGFAGFLFLGAGLYMMARAA